MHCLTVIYPRPDDEAAFKSYYEQHHVPLAGRLPGLKKMHFAFPEAVSPGDVFCIFQGYFEDGAAMGAAMGSDIGKQVAADVPNYSPKGAVLCNFPVDAAQ